MYLTAAPTYGPGSGTDTATGGAFNPKHFRMGLKPLGVGPRKEKKKKERKKELSMH